jgi:hypothetical protein
MAIFIDLECLYCKQTQKAFNVSKNTLNWLKIDSVDQKLFKIQLTREWELLSKGAGTPGTASMKCAPLPWLYRKRCGQFHNKTETNQIGKNNFYWNKNHYCGTKTHTHTHTHTQTLPWLYWKRRGQFGNVAFSNHGHASHLTRPRPSAVDNDGKLAAMHVAIPRTHLRKKKNIHYHQATPW